MPESACEGREMNVIWLGKGKRKGIKKGDIINLKRSRKFKVINW
jgi:hypothetical protein